MLRFFTIKYKSLNDWLNFYAFVCYLVNVKCYSDLKLFPCDPTFFIVYDNAATIGI